MRKLAAILFLLIMVVNVYGYQWLIACLQNSHAAFIENQVDKKEYNEEDLVSIKTILNLPYLTSSHQFERAYGSIRVNGIEYEYVKRRVVNDTLELLCLPNFVKTKLLSAEMEWAKAGTIDHTTLPTKNNGSTIKITLPEYIREKLNLELPLRFTLEKIIILSTAPSTCQGYLPLKEKPPRAV